MNTLAQIRAVNALDASKTPGMGHGQKGGDALSGFPMIIKTSGLLAACAFALERDAKDKVKRKHPGEFLIVQALATHLSHAGIDILEASTPDDLVEELARSSSDSLLRRATAEAIPYLGYLKRFVA